MKNKLNKNNTLNDSNTSSSNTTSNTQNRASTIEANKTGNAEIEETLITIIGRIFTLGGSALFLIGSFIAVIASVRTYNRLISNPSSG